MPSAGARKEEALELFAGLPRRYDELGAALSFGQDPALAAGAGRAVAARPAGPRARRRDRHRAGRRGARSPLRLPGRRPRPERRDARPGARRGSRADPALAAHIELVEGEAERLPFADGEFDHLTFTYLLRYVDDPAATLARAGAGGQARRADRLARVLRAAGRVALGLARSTRGSGCRRSAGSARASGTRSAASSGRASRASTARYPLERAAASVARGGDRSVEARRDEPRRRRRHLGDARWRTGLSAARAPPSTPCAPGGWRDLVTLLHPPYTAWHLSYVALGAAAAPADPRRPAAGGARRLLPRGRRRRPRARRAERPAAADPALRSHAGRARRGRRSAARSRSGSPASFIVSATLMPFVVVGAFIVVAYNLELFGGRFHTDFWFAAAWGAFPALTGWWVERARGRARRRRGGRAASWPRLLRAQRGAAAALDARCASCAAGPPRSTASNG